MITFARSLNSLLITGLMSASLVGGCASVRDNLPLVGSGNNNDAPTARPLRREAAPNMGVNSFLWRASLETLDFMPLELVDPFGGVIITDWYANPEVPAERFKANVYVLDANLRADALKTSIFKQVRNGTEWVDAPADADTSRKIENAILTRARELYIASVDN